MRIYAISDIHGFLEEFYKSLRLVDLSGDNKLILLGDYIHCGPNSYGVLDRIIELQQKYGNDKVIALLGNHEEYCIEGISKICEKEEQYNEQKEKQYLRWMKTLPRYYTTENQIFCHAGICEEAEDMWKLGTDDYTYTGKFPPQTGYFYMDIIAGHVGTSGISGDLCFHDVYFDGLSHYYIDSTVLKSGKLNVLMYDTEMKKYYRMTESGPTLVLPYNQENY